MTMILGIRTQNRFDSSDCIQKILTQYGCFVKTRLGLHETEECSKSGIILLEIPSKEKAILIEKKILDISGIETQRMEFG